MGAAGIAFGGSINAMSMSSYTRILGANDKIKCAVIGVRSRAKAHVKAINQDPNAKIIYSCDVDDKILEEHNAWCKENIGYVPKVEKDFRKVLEDKKVDAVFIATPEHWHAPWPLWPCRRANMCMSKNRAAITRTRIPYWWRPRKSMA